MFTSRISVGGLLSTVPSSNIPSLSNFRENNFSLCQRTARVYVYCNGTWSRRQLREAELAVFPLPKGNVEQQTNVFRQCWIWHETIYMYIIYLRLFIGADPQHSNYVHSTINLHPDLFWIFCSRWPSVLLCFLYVRTCKWYQNSIL